MTNDGILFLARDGLSKLIDLKHLTLNLMDCAGLDATGIESLVISGLSYLKNL